MSGSIDAWQGTGGATGGLAAPTMEPMALRRCRRDAHSCRARSSWVRVVSAARSRWKCARSARASSRARSAARRAAVSSARRAERASASCMALVRTCSASIVWEGAGVMCSGGEGACAGVRRGRGAQRLMGGRGKLSGVTKSNISGIMRRAPNSDAADGIAGRGARRVVPPLPPDQVSLSHDQSLRRPARRRRLPRGAEDGARASKSRKVRLSEGKVVRQKFIGRAIARRSADPPTTGR